MMTPLAITPDVAQPTLTRLCGFSIQEDSSGAAVIEIRKTNITGTVLFYIALAADESATLIFPSTYIACEGGVYVKEVSGSIAGTLYRND